MWRWVARLIDAEGNLKKSWGLFFKFFGICKREKKNWSPVAGAENSIIW